MKQFRGAIIVSLLMIVCLVGLDQWTKWAIVQNLDLGETVVLIPRLFNLMYLQNTGAGFSLFSDMGMGFFIVLTIVALAFMGYYFFHTKDLRIQLCLALICAGALGNFIDRVSLGYVRDFFSVYIFGWSFPVFNVADICISVGFVLLFVTYLYDDLKEKRANGTKNISN
jgi:signal peptidase II